MGSYEDREELVMKHTKGRWIANVWTTGRITIEPYTTQTGSVHPIAEVHQQHNNEQVPNATLIAAAPELYEACKSALAQLTDERIGSVDYMDGVDIYSDFRNAAKVAEQAIAKAEGSN